MVVISVSVSHTVLSTIHYAGLQVTCDAKWCAHEGKVFSLTWLRSFNGYSHTLLSCGPHGEMVCLNV